MRRDRRMVEGIADRCCFEVDVVVCGFFHYRGALRFIL